jgi:alcohol dehydrogenase (cytochrome c)
MTSSNAPTRRTLIAALAAAILPFAAASDVLAGGPAAKSGDWPEYHRDYRGWRYSPLDQINASNVRKLKIAWIHQPGDIAQGLQATPLAIDGVLYYIAANNRVFAVDGRTGKELWSYFTELDPITAKLLFASYNRGVAVAHGKVYFGTLDGRLIALDQKTGAKAWDTKLVDTAKTSGSNFTSPPTVAGDVVIIGPTGGDLAQRGHIYGVNAATGERIWEFETLRDDPASWSKEAIEHGGGGAWMSGQYDPENDLYYIGTSNAAPDFNGAVREGDNLYTATLLAIEPKTGKLRWHHQEVPHDVWDYDSAYETVMIDKGGKQLMTHLNKGGFVTVLDRKTGKVENVWPFAKNVTWVKSVDPKTGALIGRNEPSEAENKTLCPSVLGARSWNHGAYSPKTGLWYTNAHEFCNAVKVGKQDPKAVPFSAPYFDFAELAFVAPPGGKASSRFEAIDPLTGKTAWSIDYALPGLGSVLATGGNLVFNGDSEGLVHAYDAKSGKELWKFNVGSGIRAGLISYKAGGKQYILVPSGFGSLFPAFAGGLFPAFKQQRGGAALIAFTLE